jgi:hypothetical protein
MQVDRQRQHHARQERDKAGGADQLRKLGAQLDLNLLRRKALERPVNVR